MQSLFDPKAKNEIQERLTKLSHQSQPAWGKMDVGQMLYHCQFPLKIALKKEHPKMKPNLLAKWFFKKAMYNDKPWKRNLPTHPKLKVADQKVLEAEREYLSNLVDEFFEKRNESQWEPHPMFGKFTPEQWGKMQYKHLDHHLQQFNV